MKPGFTILPLEVWADVSEHPLITRQMLAQIADNNGDPGFTNKLQKLLHGCGKHSLRYLDISSKQSDKTTQEPNIEPECHALLAVSPDYNDWVSYVRDALPTFKQCEFAQTEMPENVKNFKGLSIRYLNDEVLTFLEKIKPLFTNVFIVIISMKSTPNDMRIVFAHLLPMFISIRGIRCNSKGIEMLEQQFTGTLACAKELDLICPEPTSIPACLNWLNATLDFHVHEPRLLRAFAEATTIFTIVDAVRKQFLAATTPSPSAFVIFLQFKHTERHHRVDEQTIENATTKEEMTVRNASFKWLKQGIDIHYAEILRHPFGTNANMREWIEGRAYFEKKYNSNGEAERMILIGDCSGLTIGHITKKAVAREIDQGEAELADEDQDEAGPSTSAKKMRI